MPCVSRFYGISIYIYHADHNPPHLHAIYGEAEALVDIRSGDTLEGTLPRRAARLVVEWCGQHRAELLANWEAAAANQPLLPIQPLD